jgi:hypothetical protein
LRAGAGFPLGKSDDVANVKETWVFGNGEVKLSIAGAIERFVLNHVFKFGGSDGKDCFNFFGVLFGADFNKCPVFITDKEFRLVVKVKEAFALEVGGLSVDRRGFADDRPFEVFPSGA